MRGAQIAPFTICGQPVLAIHAARLNDATGENRSEQTAPQIPRQQEGKQCGHDVLYDEIPVQIALANPSVAQVQAEEQPVGRVCRTWLGLSKKGLSKPLIRVPHGEPALVPLRRLHLEPRQHLVGEITRLQPRILVGENKLPVESGDQAGQHDNGQPPEVEWWFPVRVVVFGQWRNHSKMPK